MLLALDTSGSLCSAALFGDHLIAVKSEELGRGHAERLMPLLEELLQSAGVSWKDITRVATTVGPGSFTGLRVGLATARGLALALRCPCIGVTVFEAFAVGCEEPLTVALDARRDQIWMQSFSQDGRPVTDPIAVPSEAAFSKVPLPIVWLAGSAATVLQAQIPGSKILTTSGSPDVEKLALAALRKEAQEDLSLKRPSPLYLRAPDAKPQQPPQHLGAV